MSFMIPIGYDIIWYNLFFMSFIIPIGYDIIWYNLYELYDTDRIWYYMIIKKSILIWEVGPPIYIYIYSDCIDNFNYLILYIASDIHCVEIYLSIYYTLTVFPTAACCTDGDSPMMIHW